MLLYPTPLGFTAFTAACGCHGTELGVDARETGLSEGSFRLPPNQLMIPRQTHSTNVRWVERAGEVPDTDAVISDTPRLCLAVKTADCIPILLCDVRQRRVAAIHAGWRGTQGRIVVGTIEAMRSAGADLHAIIGPGISQAAFEVGDEVYEAFRSAGFPMERLAARYPATDGERWHLDLWQANRWLLEQCGVAHIHTETLCTFASQQYYSARRDTIATGRNINGVMLNDESASNIW